MCEFTGTVWIMYSAKEQLTRRQSCACHRILRLLKGQPASGHWQPITRMLLEFKIKIHLPGTRACKLWLGPESERCPRRNLILTENEECVLWPQRCCVLLCCVLWPQSQGEENICRRPISIFDFWQDIVFPDAPSNPFQKFSCFLLIMSHSNERFSKKIPKNGWKWLIG